MDELFASDGARSTSAAVLEKNAAEKKKNKAELRKSITRNQKS